MKGGYPTYRKRRAPTCKNLLLVRLCVMRLALKNISFYDIHNTLIFTYRTKYWKIGCFRVWSNLCSSLIAAYHAAYPSIFYHFPVSLPHSAILSYISRPHSPHVSHHFSVIIFRQGMDQLISGLFQSFDIVSGDLVFNQVKHTPYEKLCIIPVLIDSCIIVIQLLFHFPNVRLDRLHTLGHIFLRLLDSEVSIINHSAGCSNHSYSAAYRNYCFL